MDDKEKLNTILTKILKFMISVEFMDEDHFEEIESDLAKIQALYALHTADVQDLIIKLYPTPGAFMQAINDCLPIER